MYYLGSTLDRQLGEHNAPLQAILHSTALHFRVPLLQQAAAGAMMSMHNKGGPLQSAPWLPLPLSLSLLLSSLSSSSLLSLLSSVSATLPNNEELLYQWSIIHASLRHDLKIGKTSQRLLQRWVGGIWAACYAFAGCRNGYTWVQRIPALARPLVCPLLHPCPHLLNLVVADLTSDLDGADRQTGWSRKLFQSQLSSSLSTTKLTCRRSKVCSVALESIKESHPIFLSEVGRTHAALVRK